MRNYKLDATLKDLEPKVREPAYRWQVELDPVDGSDQRFQVALTEDDDTFVDIAFTSPHNKFSISRSRLDYAKLEKDVFNSKQESFLAGRLTRKELDDLVESLIEIRRWIKEQDENRSS